jgi:hypothetical protein
MTQAMQSCPLTLFSVKIKNLRQRFKHYFLHFSLFIAKYFSFVSAAIIATKAVPPHVARGV